MFAQVGLIILQHLKLWSRTPGLCQGTIIFNATFGQVGSIMLWVFDKIRDQLQFSLEVILDRMSGYFEIRMNISLNYSIDRNFSSWHLLSTVSGIVKSSIELPKLSRCKHYACMMSKLPKRMPATLFILVCFLQFGSLNR